MEPWQDAYILFLYRHLHMSVQMSFDTFFGMVPITVFEGASAITFKAGYDAGKLAGFAAAKKECK
jgi:hypothetical protein